MQRSRRTFAAHLTAIVFLVAGSSACSRRDHATPVATPSVEIGQQAKRGTLVPLRYRFVVAGDAPAFPDDEVVFLHVVDRQGRLLWADDHAPSTPMGQWKPGGTIEYTREMLIPSDAPLGDAALDIGLYSRGTGARLPLSGTTKGQRAYRVASFLVTSLGGAPVYANGWNNAESADGVNWRWTKDRSILSLPNPRADSTLILVADQPILALTQDARVQVAMESTPLDSFQLAPGTRQVRRIAVPASALADGPFSRVTLAVDPTFVPKSIPALKNPDGRQLGVRVFTAYFVPSGSTPEARK
jgi:hypothetical protein